MNRRSLRTPTLAATVAAGLLAAGSAGATTLTQKLDKTYPLARGGEVSLEDVNGNVTLDAWDRSEVRLVADKRVRAGDPERAKEYLAALKIDVSSSPDRLRIETRHPRSTDGFFAWLTGHEVDASVTYHLTLPRGVRLDASTVNGSIALEGVEGDLRLETVNGRVRVRDARGSLRASTTNGGIDVELTAVAPDADLAFTTTNGGIEVRMPSDVRARVEASTTNGGISTDFPITVEGRYNTKRLSGDLNGGGSGRVSLRTTNGGISLREI